MTIKEVSVEQLHPYEKNPRDNENAVRYVANSIKEFGFKVPIVIDKNNVIVAGHTRYKASLLLGLESVPCIIADDLTPKQIKAFRIADNKTNDKATWNNDLLGDELKDLMDSFDMTDFGFADFELTILTDDYEPIKYDDNEYEEYITNAETKLAKKRIIIVYNGDNEEELCQMLGLKEIDKVVYDFEELR